MTSLLGRLDRLAKHYDDKWRSASRRYLDNDTREALEDAAKEIRRYQTAAEKLMR